MRIVFCTKNDIFGAVILNWILPHFEQHEVKLLLSDVTRSAEGTVEELIDEKFFERDLPINSLFPLIDAQASTGELLTFQGCAKRFKRSLEIVQNINSPETEQALRDWAPDLIISARFSLIFKENIEGIPRHGIFNIHPGVLPGYAGLFAPLRALLNQDKQLGCTLHKVDKGIDTGEIYSVSYLPVRPQESVFNHIGDLYKLGLTSLVKLMAELEQGKTPTLVKQDPSQFKYYRLPQAEDFVRLNALGIKPLSITFYNQLLQKFIPV